MTSHRRSAASARPRAAAAHRSRLSAGFRADLRRLVALAEEVGAYSVKLGSVTVTLRLRQGVLHGAGHGSGAAATRVAAGEGRPAEPLADGGAQPDAPMPARPDSHLPQGQPWLNSKPRRSRSRAAAWHATRAGLADMQAEQMPAASSMGSAPALGAGAARARTCVGLASSESEGDEERLRSDGSSRSRSSSRSRA